MKDDMENTPEFQEMLNQMEDELYERDRNEILKFIKGKTLSEAKEFIQLIEERA